MIVKKKYDYLQFVWLDLSIIHINFTLQLFTYLSGEILKGYLLLEQRSVIQPAHQPYSH